jgi:phosphatidylserine/phosphatidylglycerophosphate/cardiolipin synthase-like enzyme
VVNLFFEQNGGGAMEKLKEILKRKTTWVILLFVILLFSVNFYHTNKSLPNGVAYEGQTHMVKDVEFLYDLTYQDAHGETRMKQEIFKEIFKTIEKAEEFIVIDMFLLNSYTDDDKYPNISKILTKKIIEQKEKNPHLKVHIITDEINTTYNSHKVELFETLKKHGVPITYTDLNKLRDPNPLYSGLWRVALQWFGQEGIGWLPNPLAENAPKVTVRSYLKLLNIKANHRKVIATEDEAIISSANAHDASGYHANIAFKVSGHVIGDILESEQAVASFSGSDRLPNWEGKKSGGGDIAIQLLTEGKIQKHIIEAISATKKGETIWLAMFYLADTEILEELKAAAERNVKINIILDPNQNAFGSEKIGLPNLPVAAELMNLADENITIRWYNTGKEQFHSKLIYVEKNKESVIIGGSANFTERNLDNYNLETNLKILAPNQSEVVKEIDDYFHRLWTNEDGVFTADYEKYQDKLPVFKYVLYLMQKLFRFTTY